jgi:hypothetical protein
MARTKNRATSANDCSEHTIDVLRQIRDDQRRLGWANSGGIVFVAVMLVLVGLYLSGRMDTADDARDALWLRMDAITGASPDAHEQ